MALIRCSECNRDISDKAAACPGCGAPVEAPAVQVTAPTAASFADGAFIATRAMMAELIGAAVHSAGYRLDAIDQAAGIVTFTTGMTMGSWAGVSGTLLFREIAPYRFAVTGSAKQNVRGAQMAAPNLFGEAEAKVENVIAAMHEQLGSPALRPKFESKEADEFMIYLIIGIIGVVFVVGFVAIVGAG